MAMPVDVGDANGTVFVGNLDPLVKEEILYELFLQVKEKTSGEGNRTDCPGGYSKKAGPVRKVTIARDREGRQRTFGFVLYKHAEAVPYAIALFNGLSLYGRPLKLDFSNGSSQDNGSFGSPGTEDRGPNAGRRGMCTQNSVCAFSGFIPHGDCSSQDQITGRNMGCNWRPCPLPPLPPLTPLPHQGPPLPFTDPFNSAPLQPWPLAFWTPPPTPLLPIAPPPREQDREEPPPTPKEREKEREREREKWLAPGKGRVRDGEKPQVPAKQRERERQKPPVRGRERDREKPLVLTKGKSKERVNLPMHPKKQAKEEEQEVQRHRRKRKRGRKHQRQSTQKT